MYEYIIGKVVIQRSNYIVIDNNGIGYMIYVANPYSFELDNEYKIFVYQYIREDENSLYGFKTLEEKELFLRLIEVKGVGCKMALPMFATGSINGIVNAIEKENTIYLKKFPKIGDKVAKQMILDLKGKLNITELNFDLSVPKESHSELIDVLKGLGYKAVEINKVVGKVSEDLSIEEQIKEALKLMLK